MQTDDIVHPGEPVIWDIRETSKASRKEYIALYSKKQLRNFISSQRAKEGIYAGIPGRMECLLLVVVTLPILFLLSQLNRNKYALLFEDILEVSNVIRLCKANGSDAMYVFCIYEPFKNLAAIALRKAGVEVNKVTSEVPLFLPNREIIASRIITCFPYQNEEVEFFEKSMFYDHLETWGPEQLLNLDKLAGGQTVSTHTLGFYSSAFWLREKLGHVDLQLDLPLRERRILEVLKSVKLIREDVELQVYLHPLEKRPESLDAAIGYYQEALDGTDWQIMDTKVPSGEQFHLTNLGVSVFSTILFERLFLGYNTLIAPYQMPGFPIPGSALRNICALDEDELKAKLLESLFLSTDAFFDKFGVGQYRYQGTRL